MKLEIEITDPKYKIGDVLEITFPKGKIIYAVVNYDETGTYRIRAGKLSYMPDEEFYWLSCQIDFDNTHRKRHFLLMERIHLEDISNKIDWSKKILQAQTVEYLTARDKLEDAIAKGLADKSELDNLAENFK